MIDISCLFATLFLIVGNSLELVGLYRTLNRNFSDASDSPLEELDPEFIQAEWEFRSSLRPIEFASHVFTAVAWVFLAIPIIQVAWIQSDKGRKMIGVPVAICVLALASCASEFLGNILQVGSFTMTEWIANDFNLDNWLGHYNMDDMIGWRTLEIAYLSVEGMWVWLDAIDWLLFSGICILLFVSTRKGGLFRVSWSYMCLVLAAFAFYDFIAGILRIQSWQIWSAVMFSLSSANRLILVPIWLIWLGFQLPKARKAFAKQNSPTFATPEENSLSIPNNNTDTTSETVMI